MSEFRIGLTGEFDNPGAALQLCHTCNHRMIHHEYSSDIFICPNENESDRIPQPKPGHPRFYELLDEISDLHSKKNTDYAKGMKEGPLGNFTRVSKIMQLYPDMDWDSPFGVALVYSFKQLDAALTLRSTRRESVTGEPISRRLMDIVIYGLIAMIIAEEESKVKA